MFKNYDAIAIFRIWGLFEAIRNLDTGRIVQKLKTELKISNATLTFSLSEGTILAKKRCFFSTKC